LQPIEGRKEEWSVKRRSALYPVWLTKEVRARPLWGLQSSNGGRLIGETATKKATPKKAAAFRRMRKPLARIKEGKFEEHFMTIKAEKRECEGLFPFLAAVRFSSELDRTLTHKCAPEEGKAPTPLLGQT